MSSQVRCEVLAPFVCPLGSMRPGQFVEVSPEVAAAWANAGIVRPVKSGSVETAESPRAETAEWTLKTAPEDYLKRFPEGPKAELARQIIEGGDAE